MPIQIDKSKLKDTEYREWLKSWNIALPDEEVEEQEDPTQQPQQVVPAQSVNPNSPVSHPEAAIASAKRMDKDYQNWEIEELREKLAEMELSKAGNRQQLIDRIKKAES